MKKTLAALALGAMALSYTAAPARAQSLPAALGGGLTAGAGIAIATFVVLAGIVIANDDDSTSTTQTP